MLHTRRTFVAIFAGLILASPAAAQTTGGATATGGAATGGAAAGSTGTFAGTVSAGFAGNAGTTANIMSPTSAFGATVSGAKSIVPTANSPLSTTYGGVNAFGNVYSMGQSLVGSSGGKTTTTSAKAFGVSIYTGTTAAAAGTATSHAMTASGFTNTAVSRVPRYTTNLGEDVPYISHPPTQLQSDLQSVIERSSMLKSKKQIRVQVDGEGMVVLVGQVGSEDERRLAASQIRLTPGVRAVDNQLVYPGQP